MNELSLASMFGGMFPEITARITGGAGFAVTLPDVPAAEQRMKLLSRTEEVGEGGCRLVKGVFHLAGLEIEAVYTLYPEGQALAFGGVIRNTLDRPAPAMRELLPVRLELALQREERVFAYTVTGGLADTSYPPQDFSFQLKEHELVAWMANHFSSAWAEGGMTWNGFSKGKELPYHLVQFGKTGGGLFFALEWPGDWHSSVSRAAGGAAIVCQAGLCFLDLRLEPGETIPLPGALIGVYQGDWIDGCNALRRTIVNHYVPKLNGKAMVPPVFYDHWFALNQNCTEPLMREQADFAARLGCEYFVQDAGWYKGSPLKEGHHFNGAGNWDNVQPDKYPAGLKPLAEFVHAQGMGFGLWVEPTRCDAESDLAKAHPAWIVFAQDKSRFNNLVDFGNPAAVAWFSATFDRLIQDNNVRWFRFDVGAGAEDYPEPPGRKGIFKIRHYAGLMRFWDHLRQRHPALLFEGCANGGRRMDLACLRRSHTFWCNDHTEHPDLIRSDLRMNLIFPANYLNHVLHLMNDKDDYPDYAYHCLMGGTWGFTEKLSAYSAKRLDDARRHVAVFKQFRHLLMKDFAPLFPYPRTLDDWDGWQWHDAQLDEGVLIVFRCLGDTDRQQIKLRWLQAGRRYEFVDLSCDKSRIEDGGRLIDEGLLVELPGERTSIILKYRGLK